MAELVGNLLVAQSGGPTAVINASLAGVIQEAGRHESIEEIYGGLNGILGILNEDLIDINEEAASKAAEEIRIQKMQKGPLMFAAIRKEGFGSFPKALITQVLYQMLAALLLTWMLLQTSALSYARRVAFLAVAGLAASVIADLPNWNWWGYSGAYVAVNLVDYTVTWLLAGLVIAKVVQCHPPVATGS